MKRNDKPITGGHALWAVERFADSTRHMIIYDQPVYDTPVGVEDKWQRKKRRTANTARRVKK